MFAVVVCGLTAVRCQTQRSAAEYVARQTPWVRERSRIVRVVGPTQASPVGTERKRRARRAVIQRGRSGPRARPPRPGRSRYGGTVAEPGVEFYSAKTLAVPRA